MALGVGTMIGGGVYVLVDVAANVAGPAAIISYLIGGLIALLTALTLSELAVGMPKSGGNYYYVINTLGPFFGSIVGVGMLGGRIFATAFYLIGFGQYLTYFVGMPVRLSAFMVGLVLIIVNYTGTKESGILQNLIVSSLIAILASFAVLGISVFNPGYLTPFSPHGVSGIVRAAGIVFVAFLGFDVIATVAEEISQPDKNIPRAMLGSVIGTTLFYLAIIAVAMGAVPLSEFIASDIPLSLSAEQFMGVLGTSIVTFGAVLATLSSANASIMGASRISLAMSRDKVIVGWIDKIHEKFLTPYRSILLTGIVILSLVLVGRVDTLAEIASFIFLAIFILVHISLIVLRKSDPDFFDPSFKCPGFPFVQILGIITSFGLMALMRPTQQIAGALILAFGVVWYYLYSKSRTNVRSVADLEKEARKVNKEEIGEPCEDYHTLVPVAEPLDEKGLMDIGMSVSSFRKGNLTALNIIPIPDQVPISIAREKMAEKKYRANEQLKQMMQKQTSFDLPTEIKAVFSHSIDRTIIAAAKLKNSDLMVMGWHKGMKSGKSRKGRGLKILKKSPCDIAVLKSRNDEYDNILVPIGKSVHEKIGIEIAASLQENFGSEITLLSVKPSETPQSEIDNIYKYMQKHIDKNDIEAKKLILEGKDAAKTIVDKSEEFDLVILGSSRKWLVKNIVFGSIPDRVAEDAKCNILIVKKWEYKVMRWLRRFFGI